MDIQQRMRKLVDKLNLASENYYGGKPELMTDYEWDALFDELKQLEMSSGVVLPDSPTNRVSDGEMNGKKEAHEFPALSLAKTKQPADLVKWAEGKPVWLSWKLDGLTLVATYDDGRLSKVVTRGNGHIGTNITHLAKAIGGMPATIPFQGHTVIRGEAVISYADFEVFNLESDDAYANPRNLASGSLTLKDVKEVERRHIQWIPFTLVFMVPRLIYRFAKGLVNTRSTSDTTRNRTPWITGSAPARQAINAITAPPANQIVVSPMVIASMTSRRIMAISQYTASMAHAPFQRPAKACICIIIPHFRWDYKPRI